MMPFLHSLIFEVSMISFWRAPGIHQFTMYPDFGTSLAATTKQASCGPKLVANMPAPHGHHVVIRLFEAQRLGKQQHKSHFICTFASRMSICLHACSACSS